MAATLIFMYSVPTSIHDARDMGASAATVMLAMMAACFFYGGVTGALTRYVVLWQSSMNFLQRAIITTAAFALFAYVGWTGWLTA